MSRFFCRVWLPCLMVMQLWTAAAADDQTRRVAEALDRAGENRGEIQAALDNAPAARKRGMEFLIAYMPQHDLQSLSSAFLLENVEFAYRAWEEAPWKDSIPEEIFLNNILPYANINESRDQWRKDFYERFQPLVRDANANVKTPAQAAALLNQQIFSLLNVRYSTQRKRADQGPYESMKSGLASCTGLSILLIDACRAVGVPARFAGTPLWSNKSGNHSWVEVWDNGWHFTGAAEPTGDQLDQAWFIGNASEARRDHHLHAIFAVSYQHTPQTFPLIWDRSIDYVFAVNVTDRYTARAEPLPEGHTKLAFRVVDPATRDRVAATLSMVDGSGHPVFSGTTKDERFDANDHLTAILRSGETYQVTAQLEGESVEARVTAEVRDTPITLELPKRPDAIPAGQGSAQKAVEALKTYLALPRNERPSLATQDFASVPLSREEAATAAQLLWHDHAAALREDRAAEMEARRLTEGELSMRFHYEVFGDKPADGRSLFISLHGGGGATPEVNDGQWENQKRLYQPEEGVYLVPRAPTNSWDLWHQAHIDRMVTRLIENMIVFEDVNPNRVYLLGYSAGGDGVYQLAPRMADQFAAASMMAGHPNEASPLGLRNLAFSIHMGERDAAYQRNEVARQWEQQLGQLRQADPEAYLHLVKIYPGKGHWLDREDAAALPWMAEHTRNPLPTRIVWRQDDVSHTRFYWLAVPPEDAHGGREVIAQRNGQSIDVVKCEASRLIVRLNDTMMNLDEPVQITAQGTPLFAGKAVRQISVLARSLAERGDPQAIFSAEVSLAIDPVPADPASAVP